MFSSFINHRISFLQINPKFITFNFYAMSSSTTTKIIAEYAKSGKSSCKKCSEKIDSKSLRLGLKVRDPRGYDNTKWHHFNCFFALDSDVLVSGVESIEGFDDLTGSDQDKLKQMVSEADTDQVPTKREGDDETEFNRGDLKKLKTDEDKENGQGKKNVTNEKIIAEYAKSGRSSCKKCSEKIESKSLRLGFSSWDPRGFENTKWHHLDCFFPLDADLVSAESIEGFSELKRNDQEKLKTLVTEGSQSSKKIPGTLDEVIGSEIAFEVGDVKDNYKREGDDETESDRGDLKKLKTGEDKETGQEKKNVTNEKIVAEYAKSGRSACKKCSEKIESKSLRLGFSSWDPRGFENTKWHHLDCIFPLDADLVSADSIEGFSELKSSDQEKLKTLVTEGGQSSKKVHVCSG